MLLKRHVPGLTLVLVILPAAGCLKLRTNCAERMGDDPVCREDVAPVGADGAVIDAPMGTHDAPVPETPPRDVARPKPSDWGACEAGFHRCGDVCRSDISPSHCGIACEPCPGIRGGEATCDGSKCGVACPAGKTACLATGECVGIGGACDVVDGGNGAPLPVPVACPITGTLPAAIKVGAGNSDSCALLGDGSVVCWGYNLVAPALVAERGFAMALAVGAYHKCALRLDRSVWCWGASADARSPRQISGLTNIRAIAVGWSNACAVTMEGLATCWSDFNPPEVVVGLADIFSITLGNGHLCALRSDGTVHCQGDNRRGQLGNGTSGQQNGLLAPVAGLARAISLAAGSDFSCALVMDGSVRCWGRNDVGQLGDGTRNDSATPVTVVGLTGASAIAANGAHACAVLANGSVRCWGDNLTGELGNGSTIPSSMPVPVSGLSGASDVAAGRYHTCAVAGGHVLCWGHNGEGQIGSRTAGDALSAVRVACF